MAMFKTMEESPIFDDITSAAGFISTFVDTVDSTSYPNSEVVTATYAFSKAHMESLIGSNQIHNSTLYKTHQL